MSGAYVEGTGPVGFGPDDLSVISEYTNPDGSISLLLMPDGA